MFNFSSLFQKGSSGVRFGVSGIIIVRWICSCRAETAGTSWRDTNRHSIRIKFETFIGWDVFDLV